MVNLEKELHRYFGHDNFRPSQDAVVQSVMEGKDTLVIMPTGGGKSLCYQLPAMLLEGVTIVVSPLIALMKDQVDQLTARGIAAAFINSSLSPLEQNERIEGICNEKYRLVYIAPERFRHARFVETLGRSRIAFFAVDEAHCVSMWGHDFRPDYLRLGEAIKQLGQPPVAAFTATATPEVRDDIINHLNLRDPRRFVTGFARPNLEFRVSHLGKDADKYARLSEILNNEKKGIVYCATRKRVEDVSAILEEWDVAHVSYHGGMTEEERNQAQDRFISKQADVAVATNAFGMGIDRADLRFVVHYQVPGSIEAYYQEAGRAGRDGKPALCELMYSYADTRVQEFFIEGSNPGMPMILDLYTHLRRLQDESHEVRMSIQAMSDEMGDRTNTMAVSTALSILTRHRYVDRFDIPGQRIRGTRLMQPALSPSQIQLDSKALLEKERRDRKKLQMVMDFANSLFCRQVDMLRYFGDIGSQPCGHCDNCRTSLPENMREAGTEERLIVQKALSGVARMSRRHDASEWHPVFGKNRIIQMLLGSCDKKVLELGLDRLSTYGLLKETGSAYLKVLFHELQRMGFLYTTGGDRPLVTLTPLGADAMKGEISIIMAWPEMIKKGGRNMGLSRRKKGSPHSLENLEGGESGSLDAVDGRLLEALKGKRMQLAMIRKMKPFQIFPNTTLNALAALKPLTVEESMDIPGIGPKRAKRFLPAFLKVIAEHRIGARQ